LSPFVGMTPATGTLRGCESEIYRWRRMAMGGNIGSATRVGPSADRIERSRRGAGAVERGGLENRRRVSLPNTISSQNVLFVNTLRGASVRLSSG